MNRPHFEITDVIDRFGESFYAAHNPNEFQRRVLRTLSRCRTAELGYHTEACDCCGEIRISYNSCRNRHCPKCQGSKQAMWVDDLMETALPVKHFHMVFTVPHELNTICMLDCARFYGLLFASVWDTLQCFGYTKYGVETAAVCILHTWGQNLSLHPHIHCIVPAAGLSLTGKLKHIAGDGQFLYPVFLLSKTFRAKMLDGLKRQLKETALLQTHQNLLDSVWQKPWVVYCEPSMGKPEQVVKYLGQYTHRVAISNQRIINIDDNDVTFMHKDYAHGATLKPIKLSGVEFLRRFCLHILPLRFVKIRRYGLYSSRHRALNKKKDNRMTIKPKEETVPERILRLTGFDIYLCPSCKIGRLHTIETRPRSRSPTANVLKE